MKIIISPAKKMKISEDHPFTLSKPLFLDDFAYLDNHLSNLDFNELCKFSKSSQKIMEPIHNLLQSRREKSTPISPALLTYQGIAFQYMAPDVFNDREWEYVNLHLRILSGAYGMLRPLDGIYEYRLEMQSKIPFSLYEYWNHKIADEFKDEIIINLASEEYAKVIRPYHPLIDILFLEEDSSGKRKEKGVYCKMARGSMVRWMATNQIQKPSDLKMFNELNYKFDPTASSESKYVFYRLEEK